MNEKTKSKKSAMMHRLLSFMGRLDISMDEVSFNLARSIDGFSAAQLAEYGIRRGEHEIVVNGGHGSNRKSHQGFQTSGGAGACSRYVGTAVESTHVVCNNWVATATCRFGEKCKFKNGHTNIAATSTVSTITTTATSYDGITTIANATSSTSTTTFRTAASMSNVHSAHSSTASVRRSTVCKNWQKDGKCRFGEKCHYKNGHS